jgi:hypothetical protein
MTFLRAHLTLGGRSLSFSEDIGNGVVVGLLHEPEERRRKQQRSMRGREIQPAKHAWWQQFPVIGHKHVFQQHIATYGGPHAHGIPLACEGDARSIARHLQVEGALDPRRIAHQQRRCGKIVGGAGE